MAKKPKKAYSLAPCTKCMLPIQKGQSFVWSDTFEVDRAAGRSGRICMDCFSGKALQHQPEPKPNTSTEPEPKPEPEPEPEPEEPVLDLPEPKPETPTHASTFDRVKLLAKTFRQVYLWGEAGTGKTTMARTLANELGLDFHYCQVGVSPEHVLFGFTDAMGEFHETPFYRAYLHGGVVCLDELDSTLPETAILLNGALENGHATFGSETIERHGNCIVVGAGNTPMSGGDDIYSARSVQDGAFRERFAFVHVPLDEGFERKLALAKNKQAGAWVDHVQATRRKLADIAPSIVCSPRASIRGAELLKVDPFLSYAELTEMLILKGAPEDVRTALGGI